MLRRGFVMGGLAALAGTPARATSDLRLMMVRAKGCVYCAQWDREIGPVYGARPEGRAAPVFMVDMDGPYPDGLALARRPWLSPTFILLRGGREMARFEGYPGADRFFGVLRAMLDQARQAG
ncbi:hypothetical protein SAMN04487972_11634 [Paracoccus halophilus]|uniref:SoxS protein n=1 Tax=Paracoccus halophilus TaxID=376733 RepID=A0A099EZY4_9RHOB|nr:SoxS protein [Paracoccus halophilus]KGJ03804.1 SoxS protein [Paracoccus halophilus]SFA56933.1 hypothetical protein SAMN04487972_11634 [Paracoccus halophilus]